MALVKSGLIVAETTEILRKRLRYQSWHRGCKETDVILGHFCDAHVEQMNEAELREFEMILQQDDADLYRWLTGEQAIPTALNGNRVLQRLLAFVLPGAAARVAGS